ncbi:MAG: branched-chain amino acid ABC transporter permease [Actinomycetota bacterium]|nr:branched-chain amino acid ABC transporter permease [Actinomycetota bacterium]
MSSTPRSLRRGRPELYSDYAADQAIWNTAAKRWSTGLVLLLALSLPFMLNRDLMGLMALVVVYAISGIGLNLVSGYAGQISLGHAVFMGLGAYTAALLGGSPSSTVRGLELDLLIWLPMAGMVPALIGWLFAPLAARVRGLYLAILTLGLLFVGEHVFKEATWLTGGSGVGRAPAVPSILGFDLYARRTVLGTELSAIGVFYLFALLLLVVMAVLARNVARTRQGRAFSAVRDRDIAAEVMGVPLLRTKRLAFTLSSFYAGIGGALMTIVIGFTTPEKWSLLLSIDFLAVVLIGGAATITGPIIGAAFVVLMPRFIETFAGSLPEWFVSTTVGGGGLLNVFQLQGLLFGVMIIIFLVAEPRGLFGVWIRIRNYFKAWPFSY